MGKSSRVIDGLKTNTLYSFYVRAKNSVGQWSDLPTVVTHTTLYDTTTPAVLSSISLLLLAGMFQLKWSKPSTLDLRGGGYKIYVYTSNTPASAVLIREVGYTANAANILIGEKSIDLSITIAAGTTYYFWVTTLDCSGNESAKVATTPASGSVSVAGITDHGALTGLGDDDHTQYIKHSLATAASNFLVASGSGAFVKKTLAETCAILKNIVILNQDAASGTGCPADTNENDLKNYTLPGGTLSVNGDLIRITCAYRMAANATTKRVRIYFGARVIADSGVTALNNTIFNVTGVISRTISATHQYAQLVAMGTDTHLNWLTPIIGDCYFPSEPLEDLDGDVIVKSTVQLGAGAALNDVIQDIFIVEFLKKP